MSYKIPEFIEKYSEFYDFINYCISHQPYGLSRVCNSLKFNVISFKKNFESLTFFTVDICEITARYSEISTNNNIAFDLRVATFNESNINALYTDCIINEDGLVIFSPMFNKLLLFYDDTNKTATFEYVDNLYKDYNIKLVETFKNLEKDYINIKKIQNG